MRNKFILSRILNQLQIAIVIVLFSQSFFHSAAEAHHATVANDYWLQQFNIQGTGYGLVVLVDGLYLTGESYNHPLLLKLTPKGEMVWRLVAPELGWGRSVTTDAQGNIYVAGYEQGYRMSAFLSKHGPNGQPLWKKKLYSDNSIFGDRVLVDPNGDVYIAGFTDSRISRFADYHGLSDVFVAKYSAQGEQRWIRQIGTEEHDALDSIHFADGQLYVFGTAKAGPNRLTKWVAKISGQNEEKWLLKIETGKHATRSHLAVDEQDQLYLIEASQDFDRSNRLTISLTRDARTVKQLKAFPDNVRAIDGFLQSNAKDRAKDKEWIRAGFSLGTDIFIYVNTYSNKGELLKQDKFNTPGFWDLAFDLASDGNGKLCLTGNTHGSFIDHEQTAESFYNVLIACRPK